MTQVKQRPKAYFIWMVFREEKPAGTSLETWIKKWVALVKKLSIKNVEEMLWMGNGSAEKGKVGLEHLTVHLRFKTAADWRKAEQVVNASKDFERLKSANMERSDRFRAYKFIRPANIKVAK